MKNASRMAMHMCTSMYTENSNLNCFLGVERIIQYIHIYYLKVSRRATESKFYNTEL